MRYFLLAILALPLIAFGQPDHSPLHDEMEAMNRSFRTLNRQSADPAQKAANLELVASMQKNLETSRTMLPEKVGELSGAEKDKYLENYASYLDKLATELEALRVALDTDKPETVKTSLDTIRKLKNESHKALGVEEERGPRRGRD